LQDKSQSATILQFLVQTPFPVLQGMKIVHRQGRGTPFIIMVPVPLQREQFGFVFMFKCLMIEKRFMYYNTSKQYLDIITNIITNRLL